MEWLIGIIGVVLGGALGAAVIMARSASQRTAAHAEIANLKTRAEMLDQQSRQILNDLERARAEVKNIESEREAAARQAAVLQEQLQAKQQSFQEQARLLAEAEKKLTDTFASAGAKALQANNQQFLDLANQVFQKLMKEASGDVEKKQQAIDNLVKPIKELLDAQNKALNELEKKREADKSGLEKHLQLIANAHEKLTNETGRLVTALRRPEVRGRWGEQQLRNVVELAGMSDFCDFIEQQTITGDDGRLRPDLIVRLPGEGIIVVDSKISLDAYFDALECEDPDRRADCLRRHAQQLANHISQLAEKRYWEAAAKLGKHTPKVVVMFVSPESALVSALESNPALQNVAMERNVLIATPTLLVALLRAVAYGWQQEAMSRNVQEVKMTAAELYKRIGAFLQKYQQLGDRLGGAVKSYNESIGTLEARVLPSARKLRELGVTSDGEHESPPPLEIEARAMTAPELEPALPIVTPALPDGVRAS